MPSRRTIEKPGRVNGDAIRARLQIQELIPAIAVGHRGADLFDQHRAAGFDRDAGQHAAGRIGHDATDTRALLRHGGRGHHQRAHQRPSPDAAKLSWSGLLLRCVREAVQRESTHRPDPSVDVLTAGRRRCRPSGRANAMHKKGYGVSSSLRVRPWRRLASIGRLVLEGILESSRIISIESPVGG